MTKSSVAIIGTGPAGLASGHFLHQRFDVTVYEKNDYAGGHANSVTVEHNGETVRFDTAFVVFNNAAYPLFMRLLSELKVPSMYCPMSFSFQIYILRWRPICIMRSAGKGIETLHPGVPRVTDVGSD